MPSVNAYLPKDALRVIADRLTGIDPSAASLNEIDDAVLAGLRFARPDPFWIEHRQERPELALRSDSRHQHAAPHALRKSLLRVHGAAGSGTSSLGRALQARALRAGYRAITITDHFDPHCSWHERDGVVVDTSELRRTEEQAIYRSFCSEIRGKSRSLTFLIPSLQLKSGWTQIFIDLLLRALAHTDLSDTVIFIDRHTWIVDHCPEKIDHLNEALKRRNCRIIATSNNSFGTGGSSQFSDCTPSDVLQGRSVDSSAFPSLDPFELQLLIEGEFLLKSGDEWLPVQNEIPAPRPHDQEPDLAMPCDHYIFVNRLCQELKARPASTMIERLDAVARAVGHHNWAELEATRRPSIIDRLLGKKETIMA